MKLLCVHCYLWIFFVSSERIIVQNHKTFIKFAIDSYNFAEKTANDLLSDLSGHDELKKRIKELCQEMDEYHNEQFDNWSREMLQRIKSQELR